MTANCCAVTFRRDRRRLTDCGLAPARRPAMAYYPKNEAKRAARDRFTGLWAATVTPPVNEEM